LAGSCFRHRKYYDSISIEIALAIEFVEDVESINKGEGGYAEDEEYFGELASI
jgi:hypothetical protein